jgi:predicted DNA-binding transcriptional regulator AlpA
VSPRKPAIPAADAVLGYQEVAERMGIDVKSVRIYAVTDPDFPVRITPPSLRSPGFSSADVDAYIERRRTRNTGSGRPPRGGQEPPRVETGPAVGARIRELLPAAQAPANTERGLAEVVGLNVAALRFRLRGQTRWKTTELNAVAAALGTTVQDLTGGVLD